MEKNIRERYEKIAAIAARAQAIGITYSRFVIFMDFDNTISGGCDIDLDGLLQADEANFRHDVEGIHTFLNHRTHTFDYGFLPRFAK